MKNKDKKIRLIFYIIAIVIFSIIETILKTNNIILGAIPTFLLCGLLFSIAELFCRIFYKNKYGKNYKEIIKLNEELKNIENLLEKSVLKEVEKEKFLKEKEQIINRINDLEQHQ